MILSAEPSSGGLLSSFRLGIDLVIGPLTSLKPTLKEEQVHAWNAFHQRIDASLIARMYLRHLVASLRQLPDSWHIQLSASAYVNGANRSVHPFKADEVSGDQSYFSGPHGPEPQAFHSSGINEFLLEKLL